MSARVLQRLVYTSMASMAHRSLRLLIAPPLLVLALLSACTRQDHGTATEDAIRRPTPVGDARLVQSGIWREVEWKLYRQPSSTGGICLSAELRPPPDINVAPRLGCGPLPSFALTSDAVVDLDIEQLEAGIYHYIMGLSISEISKIDLILSDGSTQTISPVDGTFVAFYGADLTLQELLGTSPEGFVVRCSVRRLPPEFYELDCPGPRRVPAP